MWLASRRKLSGLLLWPGALFYVLYTYLVYVLAMPLSQAFLLYLALVIWSAYDSIGLLANIDGQKVKQRLEGSVAERAGGGVLVGLGLLFFIQAGGAMVSVVLNRTPVASAELALHISDFIITVGWIIGGVLLWRHEALGYVLSLGLLFQASMLFIGLILLLVIRPLLTAVPFVLGDVVVIFAMGLVCFIPFALFVRGIVSRDYLV